MAKGLPPRNEDFSSWYTEVIREAELADYSPVRGCLVIRPNGYAIWEAIQGELNKRILATGHQNLYFPLLIPLSFLQKEAEHVEGFAPECAIVTHGGGKELEEPLVIRPTSETMIWHMYQRWIDSYRDLPLLFNQWANVLRWEMRTRPFLRTMEFLWQEGHTAHATEKEAREEATRMHALYHSFVKEFLALPAIKGKKSDQEKFAGAVDTFTLESLMPDGKALQLCTSHYLGTNFAKAFDVRFQDEEGKLSYVHATSWGATTRLIGALIMVHGDDRGLVLPPACARIKVVIVPIWKCEEEKREIRLAVEQLMKRVPQEWNTHFDDREEVHPGAKYHEWEMKGIPIRLEVGPRDLKKEEMVLVTRHRREKRSIPLQALSQEIQRALERMPQELLEAAQQRLTENTHEVEEFSAFQAQAERGGFLSAHWCGKQECELKISAETKATLRCIPEGAEEKGGKCIFCSQPAKKRVLFARAY